MDVNQILAACDHTLLLQTATWGEIQGLLDDAIESYSDGVPRVVFDKHLVDEAETIAKFTTMRELLLHIAKIAEAEGFV